MARAVAEVVAPVAAAATAEERWRRQRPQRCSLLWQRGDGGAAAVAAAVATFVAAPALTVAAEFVAEAAGLWRW